MRAKFGQVTDVADVVAFSVVLHVSVGYRAVEQVFQLLDTLQDRSTVGPAAPEVVDLTGPGVFGKSQKSSNHILTVNLIPHLLPLVSEDMVGFACLRHFDQIG